MKYYIIDAFANKVFEGNQAGVCILEKDISESTMQNIAMENNLAETAFIKKEGDIYNLRWFTPAFEIDLCGHATIASAYVIANFVDVNCTNMFFSTKSGLINVSKIGDRYQMDLPIRKPTKIKDDFADILDIKPIEVLSSRDLIVVLNSEEEISGYIPNYTKLAKLTDWLGIVITAKGNNADFVSRFFVPELNCEDAVTGSSHSSLVPYWAEKLGERNLYAKQLSKRGGELNCILDVNNVKITGKASLYLKGEIDVP